MKKSRLNTETRTETKSIMRAATRWHKNSDNVTGVVIKSSTDLVCVCVYGGQYAARLSLSNRHGSTENISVDYTCWPA